MNILFVMKHRGNAGSTHAIANYMRLAPAYGHSVAIFGTPIWYIPDLQFSTEIAGFDRVVYLFETELYRVPPLHQAILLDQFPRQHRLIIDTDGLYNDLVQLDGYDFNHATEADRSTWIGYMDALGDRIVQTVMHDPPCPNVKALPFFGFDPDLVVDPASVPAKTFDILHVGHNWWRWKEVASELLPAFGKIRDQVGEIGFLGLWWNAPPAEGIDAGSPEAFLSDPYAFQRLRIEHARGRDVQRCHQDDEQGTHQHPHPAAAASTPEASDAQVFRSVLRRYDPAPDARRGSCGGCLRACGARADVARPRCGEDA